MPEHGITGLKLLMLNIALGLGTFIQVLDTSIANVAIPYIAGSLSVSPDEGTWVITAFAASNAIVLPLTGWLSNYFGRVRLFVWSVLLFALTSFLCGLSSSLTALVTFRVLQGAVAGSLIPLSQSLIILSNPPEKQGAVMGLWGMIVVVAPIIGPILGGYITETYSWPWIFYINVPIGIISAGITWLLLRNHESKIIRDPIDWLGLFLLALGVACLQIMFDKGKDLDWFSSNVIIGLLVAAIISLTYFFIWNNYQKHRIVDFSFFKDRNFLLGTISVTIGFLIFFGSTVTIPLWLQTEYNYTPFWAGVAVAPIGIAPVFLSVFVGKYLSRFDIRLVIACSFLLFALGYLHQSNFTPQVSLYDIMLTRFYQGFGLAIFFLPLVQLALSNISRDNYASAAGLFNFVRILIGSGFGTSLAVYLWWRLGTFHVQRFGEFITSSRPAITSFYDTMQSFSSSLTPDVVKNILAVLAEQQAFLFAINDLSYMSAWACLALVVLAFFCKPIKAKSADAANVAAH